MLYYNVVMKRLVISLVAIVSLLSVAVGIKQVYSLYSPPVAPVASTQPVKPEQKPPTVDELLRLVNAERAKVGVAPLVIDADVQRSAQLKADDMYNNNYFSHIMPSTGKVLNPEMNRLLSGACVDSIENYFYELPKTTSEHALIWWRNSPPHIKAIKNPQYTKTGFGIANNSIVVEHFCIAR